jgi:hypothetical protein
MRKFLTVAVGVLALVLSAPAHASSARSVLAGLHSAVASSTLSQGLAPATLPPNSNSRSWADPAGDNEGGLAPDIQGVVFANDDLGTIGMRIDTPNFTYLIAGTFLAVFLDTDQNPATGNSTGSDFVIAIDGNSNSIGLGRWNGSTWDFTTAQSSLQGSWSGGATITINRSDLAYTSGMNFWIGASWTGINTYYDFAPDAGLPQQAQAQAKATAGLGSHRARRQLALLLPSGCLNARCGGLAIGQGCVSAIAAIADAPAEDDVAPRAPRRSTIRPASSCPAGGVCASRRSTWRICSRVREYSTWRSGRRASRSSKPSLSSIRGSKG